MPPFSAAASISMTESNRYKFTWCDIIVSFFSLGFCVAGVVIDGFLAHTYASKKQWWYFGITMFFMLVPTIMLHAFSLQWHKDDKRASGGIWLINVVLFGITHRHWDTLKAGVIARKTNSEETFRALSQHIRDLSVLDLYKAFLKSAPQLVLQGYIALDTKDWSIMTIVSCVYGVFMVPLCMATYDRAERRWGDQHPQISWCGTTLQFLWRFGTVGSRIGAMVLRGVVSDAWAMFIFGTHFFATTVFAMVVTRITLKERLAPDVTWWQKTAHCIAMGAGFTFCFINVGDTIENSISTAVVVLMYTYSGQENLEAVVAYTEEWINEGFDLYGAIVLGWVVVSFIIGVICMCIYRCCYHPACQVALFPNRTPLSEDSDAQARTPLDIGDGDAENDKEQLLQVTVGHHENTAS